MKDLIACLDQRQLAKNPQVWGGVGAGVGVGVCDELADWD